MVEHPKWPASCARLYQSVREGMIEVSCRHKEKSGLTYPSFDFVNIGKDRVVFSMTCMIKFVRDATVEQQKMMLRGLNHYNERMVPRKVMVSLPDPGILPILGPAKNVVCITFEKTNELPDRFGVRPTLSFFYADDGVENSTLCWPSSQGGPHITEFLTQGTIKGKDFLQQLK